jgi:hypothetical protein
MGAILTPNQILCQTDATGIGPGAAFGDTGDTGDRWRPGGLLWKIP